MIAHNLNGHARSCIDGSVSPRMLPAHDLERLGASYDECWYWFGYDVMHTAFDGEIVLRRGDLFSCWTLTSHADRDPLQWIMREPATADSMYALDELVGAESWRDQSRWIERVRVYMNQTAAEI